MISWLLHVNNRWSKSSVAWQLGSRATWTCAAVIYLLLWTESDPCSCETDEGGGGVNFAEGGEMPTAAQLHQEQKTELLTDPLAFHHSWRQIKDLVILPASCPAHCSSVFVGAVKCLWPWAALPRLPQPTLAQPCRAQGCLQLVLLCCASRGCCWAQEGHEAPLVALFSASPHTPIMSAMSASLQKLGKASDVCRLVCCLFVKSPCVSCQMDRKGLLLSPRSLHPAALWPAIYQEPTAALSPFKLTALTWIPASSHFCSL